jgi:hypothetical protein
MEAPKSAKLRLGWIVIGGLAVLTALEFWVASMTTGPIPYPVLFWPLAPITWIAVWASRSPLPFLALFALAKAGLIIYYFMHVAQLWRREEEHA